MESNVIYYIGIALIGLSILFTMIATPLFIMAGRRLKEQLEREYGETP